MHSCSEQALQASVVAGSAGSPVVAHAQLAAVPAAPEVEPAGGGDGRAVVVPAADGHDAPAPQAGHRREVGAARRVPQPQLPKVVVPCNQGSCSSPMAFD